MNRDTRNIIENGSIPEPNSGCWLWTGAACGSGYAWVSEVKDRGHRVSWRAYHGDIPCGMYVCHKCDTRICVNPDHLFLGTPADNNHDMMSKGRFVAPMTKGVAHGRSKLSEADIIDIRSSPLSGPELREKYNVSTNVISRIRRRKLWAHVA